MEKSDESLNEEKYVSYNEYRNICKKNNQEFDEKFLNEKNERFINKKLVEYRDYFDNIFANTGEKINLDEEQRRIILRDDDCCLINAGAGSGKSTTMAAKVKYLVDKLNIKPEEIIMLSFTKKSSEDLDEKVNYELKLGVPVSTFHSLGMKFVRKFYSAPVQIIDENIQKTIISDYIRNNFKDKKKIKDLITLFKYNTINGKALKFNGFIENYDKFSTFDEYFEDYKKRKFEKEDKKTGGIHKYIENRLDSNTSLYTIKGERVKSYGELKIANFLYKNGIDYSYERLFKEKVNDDLSYQPDFTIDYHGKTIYIEYFGLSSCYNDKNELIRQHKIRYDRIRRIKEKYQREHNCDFINLDYMNKDEDFIKKLEKELIKREVKFDKISDDEIFNTLMDNNLSSEFFQFNDLMVNFIDTFKNMLTDDDDYMFDKRIKEIQVEDFRENYYSKNREEEAISRIKAIRFLKEIYNYYQKYLLEHNMIDYNDMIKKSYQYIIEDVKNRFNDINYKYIIVDEYQDITFQRFLFIKKLLEYFDAKLITVGDDWQSIYGFNGSRLELFNKFTEKFPNAKNDMFLSTTYRYGQELVDISSKFILENVEQSYKKIKSTKNLKHPIEIVEYEKDEEIKIIDDLVTKLYNENKENNILILARTNYCLNDLTSSDFFDKGINDIIINKRIPEAKIEALTVHRSKGLTADQVIVFGLKKDLFPNRGRIDHWIYKYFYLDSINDIMPFAEERRLFYVAITRTRNKVYLVVPENVKEKSEFINEIQKIIEMNN